MLDVHEQVFTSCQDSRDGSRRAESKENDSESSVNIFHSRKFMVAKVHPVSGEDLQNMLRFSN
jgi:hypothetical protein